LNCTAVLCTYGSRFNQSNTHLGIPTMSYFDFERLDVYQASIEIIVLIDTITEAFPRGRAYLTDQLQRAGTSISLNIAEGAGEFSPNEKSRFYRMAKRSATETAAILEVAKRLGIIQENNYQMGRELLIRIVMMLTKMAQKTD
jgi:four helix bundle protein